MIRVILIASMTLLLPMVAFAQTWDPTGYTITFTSNVDQEADLRELIYQECNRLVSSAEPVQPYCTTDVPHPNATRCLVCEPNVTQKTNFLRQHYLARGFNEDRRRLARHRWETVGNRYRNPSTPQTIRDQIDALLGLEVP